MLKVVCGGVCAGKSTYALNFAVREQKRHNSRVVYYSVSIATNKKMPIMVCTHDGEKSHTVSNCYEVPRDFCFLNDRDEYDVFVIDEVQFLYPGVLNSIRTLVDTYEKSVLVVGLDMDFEGNPFEVVSDLLCYADEIEKLKAVCSVCGKDATYSFKKIRTQERFDVGGIEKYSPMCRQCFCKSMKR